MAKREFFPCYHSYLKKCEKLTDQELGRLFRALLEYSSTGERQELAGRESIAFDFMADDIDRASAAYAEKCDTNSQNGKRGGRPKNQTVSEKPNGFQKSQYKDEDKSEDKEKKKEPPLPPQRGAVDVFSEYAGGDEQLLSALKDFEAMRKKIKRPMTDRAKKQLCARLDELSAQSDRVSLLNEAVLHCWQSVYPPKGGTDGACGTTERDSAGGGKTWNLNTTKL